MFNEQASVKLDRTEITLQGKHVSLLWYGSKEDEKVNVGVPWFETGSKLIWKFVKFCVIFEGSIDLTLGCRTYWPILWKRPVLNSMF